MGPLRFCSFALKSSKEPIERVGLIVGGSVIDFALAVPRVTAGHVTGSKGPVTMVEILDDWDRYVSVAEKILADASDLVGSGKAPVVELSDVRLLAPIPRPRKIVATMVNSRGMLGGADVAEQSHPNFFMKAPSTVVGPDATILAPPHGIRPEIELAMVIGKKTRHCSAKEAEEAIAGYTILNDVTAPRDLTEDTFESYRRDQATGEVKKRTQRSVFRAKNHDTFTPMGPWIVTPNEVGQLDSNRMITRYNGEVIQDGSPADYAFKPTEIISFISSFMTLEPGDIVSAGSIGWAKARLGKDDPSEFVLPRSEGLLELGMEKIGTLRNYVKSEQV